VRVFESGELYSGVNSLLPRQTIRLEAA